MRFYVTLNKQKRLKLKNLKLETKILWEELNYKTLEPFHIMGV